MPTRIRKLPDPTTWKYVLVHRYFRHINPIRVVNYTTTVMSFRSIHKGIAKPTFVTNDINLMRQYSAVGWMDVTKEVRANVDELWDSTTESWKVGENDDLLPWERAPVKPKPLPVEIEPEEVEKEIEITGPDKRKPTPKRTVRGAAKQPSTRPRKAKPKTKAKVKKKLKKKE